MIRIFLTDFQQQWNPRCREDEHGLIFLSRHCVLKKTRKKCEGHGRGLNATSEGWKSVPIHPLDQPSVCCGPGPSRAKYYSRMDAMNGGFLLRGGAEEPGPTPSTTRHAPGDHRGGHTRLAGNMTKHTRAAVGRILRALDGTTWSLGRLCGGKYHFKKNPLK